jgi:colanic acid/amylovoran biosynthesis protein
MIDRLTEEGVGVRLIPQLFGNQNDTDYLKTFVDNDHTLVMSDEPDTYFQQHVISKLYAVVGMRYHCNIFAAKMGVPFVAVAYEEKMNGFLEMAGLSEYGMNLEEVTFEGLWEKFQALESHHNEIRKIIIDHRNGWREKARRTVELLLENYIKGR